MSVLAGLILGFLGNMFKAWLSSWLSREAGRREVLEASEKSHEELADLLKAEAEHVATLDDTERERLRVDKRHYRD